MIIPVNALFVALAAVCGLVILRTILSARALLYHLGRWWRWVDERVQAYQYFEIPRYNEGSQENPLYRKAAAYVASLPSIEDADAATLSSSGRKPNDFLLHLGPGQSVPDSFLGARLSWSNRPPGGGCLVLRVRRQDRTRVLRPYLQHVESVANEIELRRREVRLFTNSGSGDCGEGPRWRSVPFTHPSTLDTVAIDPELKTRVRADLEAFVKGRAYYHRLGRVWRRSYLLYGPPGTGKTTFAAAMAKFLCYDIYDVDLSRLAADGADLRSLLLQTAPRSVILVEDLDRYLSGNQGQSSSARLTGMLGFMDGVFSCCGEERLMVVTMSGGDGGMEELDPAMLRPGRLDVHIHFPLCDFSAFKTMASRYLGLEDHKLYPQVEEGFQYGAQLSPAEVGEIMIANRVSPSRAIKSVISALQQSTNGGGGRKLCESWSTEGGGGELGFGKDFTTMREFRKLYGLLKMKYGSRKEGVMPVKVAAAAAAAGTLLDKDYSS
ncbi:AAA-ATPase At2g46620-like [Phoenix dactylifera]|uniref:AAA-ATPase At2g46620-like n=1 Tax=Phoenix dactylifera TaxID=42345 RepID=A0A8B7MWS3_PHODC|nr:AAA-ATPase At2g46620-like [Phoenix dactylifera]